MGRENVAHQEELDGPQDVHGSGERGPQIETDPHCSPKLRPQGAGDHVVGASSCAYTHTHTGVNRKEMCVSSLCARI